MLGAPPPHKHKIWGSVFLVLVQWLFVFALCLPLLALAGLYLCREALRRSQRWRRFRAGTNARKIQVTITLMSGRTVLLDANEASSIREVKQALAGLGVAPTNQIRLLDGCNEMDDSDLVGDSGRFSLVLRSVQCAEWLDRLAQGDACSFAGATDEILLSKECAIAAVRNFTSNPLHEVPAFIDDTDVVIAAVLNDGMSLFDASSRLRTDLAVSLTAISRDRGAILAVHEPLRSDPDFLRRAYWASSLDCRSAGRTGVDGGDSAAGGFPLWEDVLYQRCGPASRMFWSFVHALLTQNRFSQQFSSPLISVFALLGLNPYTFRMMKQISRWSLFLISTLLFVLYMAVTFGFNHVLEKMHVELVAYMAGHLVKPRRSK